MQIAATTKLKKKDAKNWVVPSQSGKGRYEVVLDSKAPRCSCPDHIVRGVKCKHIHAVEYTIKREYHEDGSETVTETIKVTYSQDWTNYNKAQVHEKEYFIELLSSLTKDLPEPPRTQGKAPGGRKPLPFSDMTFSAVYKVYSGLSARRFSSDLRDMQTKGFIDKVPHFNSVLNHLEREELTPVLRHLITESSKPLAAIETHFAADASSFSSSKLDNWNGTKYQGRYSDRHTWVKCHIMIGARTNTVTACEVGSQNENVFFPHLINATDQNFNMEEVSADKGYLSRRNLELIDSKGAFPLIPFKQKPQT